MCLHQHIHTANTIAHCPYHYDAQTLTFVFIHTFAHCTLFLSLFCVRISFRGSLMRIILSLVTDLAVPCPSCIERIPVALSSIWRPLSGESFIGGTQCSFRSLLSLSLNLLLSFDLLPPAGTRRLVFALPLSLRLLRWLCPATNVSARPIPHTYTQCEYYACKIAECGYFRSNQCKVIRTVDANSVVEMSPCPPKYLCSYCLQIPHTQVFGCFDNTLY